MNFTDAVRKEINKDGKFTRTENMGKQFATTKSSLLDLFATIGAMRQKTNGEIINAFTSAFNENPLMATRMAFYARNIRDGGLGERRTFRIILKWLGDNHPSIIRHNANYIAEFGRYDDLYELVGTKSEETLWNIVQTQFYKDLEDMQAGKKISLLAKWLKSVNASSKETNRLGKLTAQNLCLHERTYRKILSKMRAYIDVVERKMSSSKWSEIDYSGVPSRAMTNYHCAFYKNDPTGFEKYIQMVKDGKVKINSSTLYPYDIVRNYGFSPRSYYGDWFNEREPDPVLEEQWKALPNYIIGQNNILVMADTSGSMSGLPMSIAIGLAVYFAERNSGAYKDLFLTFSGDPQYVKISGNTLKEKLSGIKSIVANTDIEKAFKLILKTAVENNVPQEEIPASLIVISDMEFDESTDGNRSFKTVRKMFENAGYKLPTVVYWNVSQRTTGYQVRSDTDNVILVSGASAGTFKNLLSTIGTTPYEFMEATLSKEPYTLIDVPSEYKS